MVVPFIWLADEVGVIKPDGQAVAAIGRSFYIGHPALRWAGRDLAGRSRRHHHHRRSQQQRDKGNLYAYAFSERSAGRQSPIARNYHANEFHLPHKSSAAWLALGARRGGVGRH